MFRNKRENTIHRKLVLTRKSLISTSLKKRRIKYNRLISWKFKDLYPLSRTQGYAWDHYVLLYCSSKCAFPFLVFSSFHAVAREAENDIKGSKKAAKKGNMLLVAQS